MSDCACFTENTKKKTTAVFFLSQNSLLLITERHSFKVVCGRKCSVTHRESVCWRPKHHSRKQKKKEGKENSNCVLKLLSSCVFLLIFFFVRVCFALFPTFLWILLFYFFFAYIVRFVDPHCLLFFFSVCLFIFSLHLCLYSSGFLFYPDKAATSILLSFFFW